MIHPDVTLATYTFNDARLMQGLLAHMDSWSVRPARIVVVDDGSDEPFRYRPQEHDCILDQLEIVRYSKNRGLIPARVGAVEAARTPYVLNMDSDVRLPPDWLERMLPLLESDSEMGMVSSVCHQSDGPGLGTRYMHANSLLGIPTGAVCFLDGYLWLLRKAAWDSVGGLSQYSHFCLDDHEFCRRLLDGGWRMVRTQTPVAAQVRRFDRVAAVRRLRQWQVSLAESPLSHSDHVERLKRFLVRSMRRWLYFWRNGEGEFAYVELLYLAALFLGGMERLIPEPSRAASTRAEFAGLLYAHLRQYGATWDLLRNDLAAMGHPIHARPVPHVRVWPRVSGYLLALRRHGVLDWLENGGAETVYRQDAGAELDYSFYNRESAPETESGKGGLPAAERDPARRPLVQPHVEAGPPLVLFVIDIPNWALDIKTDSLRSRLASSFRTEKAYHTDLAPVMLDRADIVVFFFWKQLATLRFLQPALLRNRHKFMLGVSGWRELGGYERDQAFAHLDGYGRGVYCVSESLWRFVSGQVSAPVYCLPHGVDTRFFRPAASRPARNGPLVAGWAGSTSNYGPIRGLDELIRPGVARAEGWTLRLAAREDKWRNAAEMVHYYRGLDAYICGSVAEGGPNPCLEASACGVPVITTPVGMMPEFIRDGVNGFLVGRDPREVADRLDRLSDPRLRADMGRAARARAEEHDWDIMAENYRRMFEEQLGMREASA